MGELSARLALEHHQPYTLLTGATGLLGQYLLRDLLLQGHRIAVVVRNAGRAPAAARVERILQRFESELGRYLPRPIVLTGDIHQPGLGLDPNDRQFVADYCSSLIHNAAVLKFHGAQDPQIEPWLTNVEGTRQALSLADESGIRHFHYVSTAYVCGCRTGTIMEDEFERGQDFRNDYERSKFAAEKLVRQSSSFASATIYRPVVIAGDSETGFTSSYHGLYVYLRLFALFVPEQERGADGRILTPVHVPLDGDEPRNVVPVDWVSAVFCRLFGNPAARGRTYHLAPEKRLTPRQVIEACYEYFDSHGVRFCGINSPRHRQPDFAERIFDNIAIYQQYETSDPAFDTANVRQFASDIPCPEIDARTIHRYLQFGESDQWGKSRKRSFPASCVQPSVDQLKHLAAAVDSRLPVGIRLTGPGGGDWTVEKRPGTRRNGWTLTRGCRGDASQLLVVESGQSLTPETLTAETISVDGQNCSQQGPR